MKAAGLFCSGGKCSYEIKSPSGGARSGGKEDGLTLLSASGTLLTLRRYHIVWNIKFGTSQMFSSWNRCFGCRMMGSCDMLCFIIPGMECILSVWYCVYGRQCNMRTISNQEEYSS